MQLSIEAIIILVIAFTLLGFGIVFVKNVFGKGGNQVDDYLTTKACTTASSEYPIAPQKFTVDKGGAFETKLCVYNNAASDLTEVQLKIQGCKAPPNADGTPGAYLTADIPISIDVAPLDIKRNKGGEYQPTFRATNAASLGTYICNIYAQKADSTGEKIGPVQITVEVK